MASLHEWAENLGQPYVILGVGIPGAGKTTVLEALANTLEIARICPDDIRKEMTGSESDQSANKAVWEETYARVCNLLQEGKSSIVDATHVNRTNRVEAIEKYRAHGAQNIGAVIFRTPLQLALIRNQLRTKHVPDEVIRRMNNRLKQHPVVGSEEGIDRTYTVMPTDSLVA